MCTYPIYSCANSCDTVMTQWLVCLSLCLAVAFVSCRWHPKNYFMNWEVDQSYLVILWKYLSHQIVLKLVLFLCFSIHESSWCLKWMPLGTLCNVLLLLDIVICDFLIQVLLSSGCLSVYIHDKIESRSKTENIMIC